MPRFSRHHAAQRLDTIETIHIYDGIKPPPGDDIFFGYAVPTIIDELTSEVRSRAPQVSHVTIEVEGLAPPEAP